jgi:Phage Mu protein F like protein
LGILDKFFKKSNDDLRKTVQRAALSSIKKSYYSGRETSDKISEMSFWYEGIIRRNELRQKDIIEKLKIVRDVNPDASMAIWNFLRLANNGHELEAQTFSGKTHKGSTDYLNEIAKNVGAFYGGGTDQLINVLLLTAFTQGAVALEVELDEGLDNVVDFHAIDPYTLEFRKDKDTGELQLIQKQRNGEYKILNREQVFYYPIDPDISDPYGRTPLLPVLQVVFFQAQVLRDLKKVVHHQGYERFDISVVEEAIMENMPEYIKSGGPEEVSRYVASYIADIQNQMNSLEPDDDFFHTDSVKIDMVGGTTKGSMDATSVMNVINQQIVTALKQLPILLGRNEGTTETHGTIQLKIYMSGIESVQRAIKRVLEKAYNVALQVKGKQLRARLTFDNIPIDDRLKDAQAEEIETRTKVQQVNQGWVSNDEAAFFMVGHEAVDEPKQMNPIIKKVQAPEENEDDEEDEDRQQLKKKEHFQIRADLIKTDESWANGIEDITEDAQKSFYRFLKRIRNQYIDRLESAENIPSRILADVQSLRSIHREDKPDPTPEFENWVSINILIDSPDVEAEVEQLTMEWSSEGILYAGMETMASLNLDMDFNMENPSLLRWLSNRSRRSAQLIQGVTDEGVLMTLWDVVYEGNFTIKKASDRLREIYEFSESRAETIARNEIITAGRSGQYFGDIQSGMVIGKKWRSANQERTRDAHRNADGQVVRVDEPFIVDGEQLLFPGDTSLGASASNVIQCRCWYKRILEGEEDQLD